MSGPTYGDGSAEQYPVTRENATSYVVHEGRNALVPARFHVDRLLEEITDPAQRERLVAIRRGIVRVLDMVEDVAPLLDAGG